MERKRAELLVDGTEISSKVKKDKETNLAQKEGRSTV
jgi:hypothetical protein